jgi:integrase
MPSSRLNSEIVTSPRANRATCSRLNSGENNRRPSEPRGTLSMTPSSVPGWYLVKMSRRIGGQGRVSLWALQQLLGHSTGVMTQRYSRLGDDAVRLEAGRAVSRGRL